MKKISFQKTFCFISFLFIFSCCIFYGTRFIKLYLENKKEEIIEENTLAKELKNKNLDNENFKSINGSNYFINKEENNYLLYSGILFRIIKVNDDNSIELISDKGVTSLKYGSSNYEESDIYRWLNSSNSMESGILEKSLNNKDKYLVKFTTCVEKMDELTNNPCKNYSKENYVGIPSVIEYLNIGSKDSYINNQEYFYLSNANNESKVWYVNDEGRASNGDGNDGYGIKIMIKLKPNIKHTKGDGSKNNPYLIEEENGLFGSYVKLGNDYYRIYQVNDNDVRLALDSYLMVNGSEYSNIYSNNTSYHNDTKAGSMAYYLNNNFLNSLPYKDKIKEVEWSNGYYENSNNYDYAKSLNIKIKSKVAMQSVGDIILNSDSYNYMLMTGTRENGTYIYSITKDKKLVSKSISQSLYVIPTISLDKELLKKGNGTKESPYEME